MRSFVLCVLISAGVLAAQGQKELPRAVTNARFVFVETVYGSTEETISDSRVRLEDRRAVANIEQALRSWGRYSLTTRRADADVVLVVRTGLRAGANAGVRINSDPPRVTTVATFGAEVGTAEDSISVHLRSPEGSLGNVVWRATLDHGLDAPRLFLFEQFKNEVEHTAATAPKKNP
jgi:hypothetical protein